MKSSQKLLILLCALAASAFGQSTDAAITGTVRDSSAAVVAGAKVSAENKNTGVVLSATTNSTGIYSFPTLSPGEYRLSAESAGFSKAVLDKVTLAVGARLTLDLSLALGQTSDVVEVSADGKLDLAYATSTVGGTVDTKRITELPLTSRNVLGFTTLQAGTVGSNFSGARIGTLNIQVDGVNVQDGRINTGVSSTLFLSVDRIEEIRVVTSPADAEFGRGSGQVQTITRSGTNELRGSLFEFHRNTVLNANNWFNNFQGRNSAGDPVAPRNNLIRNQFGARVGGPIIIPKLYNGKNKTFFHFLYEGQREREKSNLNSTVLTPTARQGIYRFFPGVQNGNANTGNPVVDFQGNPLTPRNATGPLNSVNLFGIDPNRRGPDATGAVKAALDFMPLPNNYILGDGLNTAGYNFTRSITDDFNNYNVKFDHYINANHIVNFSYSAERSTSLNGFQSQRFPNAPGGTVDAPDSVYSLNYKATLSPTILNEARVGILRSRFRFNAPWEVGDNLSKLSRIGSNPYLLDFVSITDPILTDNDPQGRLSPNYQYSDNLSWVKGKHSFKAGAAVWFTSSNGFNSFDVMPRVVLGRGTIPNEGINTLPGIGANATGAENILNDLAGSVASVRQALNSPGGANPSFLAGEGKQRVWQQREWYFFIKDDWRISRSLTLNIGMRYELFQVPQEKNGKATSLVGGEAGLFGISGTNFGSLFQPGLTGGSFTQINLVGKNSPNAGQSLYSGDHNNFAPAIGLSWSVPFLGRDKTIIRAGYSMGYERPSIRILDVVSGDQPGLRQAVTEQVSTYRDIRGVRLPLTATGAPLSTIPVTDRLQTVRAYDRNIRVPYVQNFNFSLQRQLPGNMLLDLRYVGNKGSKLIRGATVNEQNAIENGLAAGFIAAQRGEESALLDRVFQGPRGALSGSAFARTNATTAAALANNNLGAFTNFINSVSFNNRNGGYLAAANLPENFIVANPQFAAANLTGNFANSTYHSFQAEVTKRLSKGLTLQANYTFAKALGEEEGAGQEQLDNYRTQRNRKLDKRLLSFSTVHVFRSNFTYSLPFGKNRKFLNSSNGFVSRLVGDWQVGTIYNKFSGAPVGFVSNASSFNQFTDGTPVSLTALSPTEGTVSVTGNAVTFFPGWTQTSDPYRANLTTANGLQARNTNQAIRDASGNIILQNAAPGQLGTMSQRSFFGPGTFRLDLNVIKRVQIKERIVFELNATAENVSNTPQWDAPTEANRNINSLNFGRITTAGGARIVTIGGRINF
jgi:hypothetical protein